MAKQPDYLFVSCIVALPDLPNMLRALTTLKAGNVEVRPVEGPVAATKSNGRALPGSVSTRLDALLPMREKVRAQDLIEELKAHPKSVYSRLHNLKERGIVRRVGEGVYMRIKEDQ